MSDPKIRLLASAVIQQALDDYRYLLSNGLEKATEKKYTYGTAEIRRFLCGKDGRAILRSLYGKYRVPVCGEDGRAGFEPVSGETLLHAIENQFIKT